MSLRNITLQDIQDADSTALSSVWKKLFSFERPGHLPRDLTTRLLSHALQERTHGELKKTLARQLDASIEACASNDLDLSNDRLRLGTRLVRGWGGQSHEVTVMERGFAYRGRSYRSLSEVARVITGVRWSGPRFFGTRTHAKERP
jgi:Protein of unknown function (DUF2924)